MIVTTAGKSNLAITSYANQVAKELNAPFVNRLNESISTIQNRMQDDVLVVGKNRLEVYPRNHAPFFFHPNSSSFRIKRLMRGEHDPFIEASKLKAGMTVLDCTLGLASDSIVASYVVGNRGQVTGIEGNAYMAYIVQKGLMQWKTEIKEMDQAMKRISVINNNHLSFLRECEDQSYDVVYFDPMFEESILDSDGIRGLKHFALYQDITDETFQEAFRVAKERIILKDHFRSSRFEKYGFLVYRRKSAKFHFGVLEKG